MGDVITEAVTPLLASGTWQGIVVALLLVLVVALAKVYGLDALRFFKPSGPQRLDPEHDPTAPDAVLTDSDGTPVTESRPPPGESGEGG